MKRGKDTGHYEYNLWYVLGLFIVFVVTAGGSVMVEGIIGNRFFWLIVFSLRLLSIVLIMDHLYQVVIGKLDRIIEKLEND